MSWMLRYSHEDEDGRKEVFAVTYQGRFLDFFQLLKEAGSHMGWDSNTTNKMNKMIAHYHDLAPDVQFNVEMFSIREQIYLVKNEIDQCAVDLQQSDTIINSITNQTNVMHRQAALPAANRRT